MICKRGEEREELQDQFSELWRFRNQASQDSSAFGESGEGQPNITGGTRVGGLWRKNWFHLRYDCVLAESQCSATDLGFSGGVRSEGLD